MHKWHTTQCFQTIRSSCFSRSQWISILLEAYSTNMHSTSNTLRLFHRHHKSFIFFCSHAAPLPPFRPNSQFTYEAMSMNMKQATDDTRQDLSLGIVAIFIWDFDIQQRSRHLIYYYYISRFIQVKKNIDDKFNMRWQWVTQHLLAFKHYIGFQTATTTTANRWGDTGNVWVLFRRGDETHIVYLIIIPGSSVFCNYQCLVSVCEFFTNPGEFASFFFALSRVMCRFNVVIFGRAYVHSTYYIHCWLCYTVLYEYQY